jgi:hypothetical protein
MELEQERASGKVFELTRWGIPLPALGQSHRQTPSAPKRIGRDQFLNLTDFPAADPAALNEFVFEHAGRLPREILQVPYKMKKLSCPLSSGSDLILTGFDLSSYSAGSVED